MFRIGEDVMVRKTYELFRVKAIEERAGETLYVCGREAGADRRFAEDELIELFPGGGNVGTTPAAPER